MDQKLYKLCDFVEAPSVSMIDPQVSLHDKFVGLEHYDSREPVISRFSGKEILTSTVKEFKKGDLLIARRNVYLERAGLALFDGITSGDSIILRVKNNCEEITGVPFSLADRILPFVLNSNSFWAYANRHADGMNSKRISKDKILEFEFNLPSLEEQKILAEKLWAAYELKQSYIKMIAATDEMVKSQFIEMFKDEKKVSINTLVKTTWGSSPDSSTYNDNQEGLPFYQGKTEFGDIIIGHPSVYCSAPIKTAEKDAILMSVRAPVGAVNIAYEKCCIGRGLAAISPIECKAEQYFIFYALRYIEDEIEKLGTGSTFKAINKDSFAKILLPEASIEKQLLFVEIAKQADKSKFELQNSIAAIDKVIKSLINENI